MSNEMNPTVILGFLLSRCVGRNRLARAFGFEKQAVSVGPDNTVAHAQLTLRRGMIMLAGMRRLFNP